MRCLLQPKHWLESPEQAGWSMLDRKSRPPSLNFLTVAILLVGWNYLDLRMRYESPGFFGGFLISSMNSLLSEKVLAMRAL